LINILSITYILNGVCFFLMISKRRGLIQHNAANLDFESKKRPVYTHKPFRNPADNRD